MTPTNETHSTVGSPVMHAAIKLDLGEAGRWWFLGEENHLVDVEFAEREP